MKILFAIAEVYPFSKSRGLSDTTKPYVEILKEKGQEVKVISPLYKKVKDYLKNFNKELTFITKGEILHHDRLIECEYLSLLENGIEYIFIKQDEFFHRDTNYGHLDDPIRFLYFNKAVLHFINNQSFKPDIIHCNDWHTGFIPYFLQYQFKDIKKFKDIKTLLTIHNLQYQGVYHKGYEVYLNTKLNVDYINYYNLNFLKCGIQLADKINFLSNVYKDEILNPENSFSLSGVINYRINDIYGILNGINFDIWKPEKDNYIYKKYSKNTFTSGKKENKKYFYTRYGLIDNNGPLISFIAKLLPNKGVDLITEILEEVIIYSNANFAILGKGDEDYEEFFKTLQAKFPRRVYIAQRYDEALAHQIYASSDSIMIPSLYSQSGINHLISFRYGCIPLVRNTGILKETVIDINNQNGNGLVFNEFLSYELKETLFRFIRMYEYEKPLLKQAIKNGLKHHHSINDMANDYIKLYKDMVNN